MAVAASRRCCPHGRARQAGSSSCSPLCGKIGQQSRIVVDQLPCALNGWRGLRVPGWCGWPRIDQDPDFGPAWFPTWVPAPARSRPCPAPTFLAIPAFAATGRVRPQRWPMVAVRGRRATTTMGQRCCRHRIHGTSMRLPRAGQRQRWDIDAVKAQRNGRPGLDSCREAKARPGRHP